MSLIYVLTKDTKEVTCIDTNDYPNYANEFLQLEGWPLSGATETSEETSEIEQLREEYKAKYGKDVATTYKNNIEWIKSKLAE